MHNYVTGSLQWFVSLGLKFFSVVPYSTILIVILTLLSQVSVLFALLLPLKVVVILGSEGIPKYLLWLDIDKNSMVLGFAAATVVFFSIHLLAEYLISRVTENAINKLLLNTNKIAFLKNQAEVSTKAYTRYSKALAGGVFVFLSLITLLLIYPSMAFISIGYGVVVGVFLVILGMRSASFKEALELKISAIMKLIGTIGFFMVFFYLTADFVLWEPPDILVAIICLLLSRQLMTRASVFVIDLQALMSDKSKIVALFFHNNVYMSGLPKVDKQMWELLQPEVRNKWVGLLLEELGELSEPIDIKWQNINVRDVAALRVRTMKGRYLIKFFGERKGLFAEHEATIMMENITRLPSLFFIGTTRVQGFQCIVYRLSWRGQLAKEKRCNMNVLLSLLLVSPPRLLESRYSRSKLMLWERLSKERLVGMKAAADSEQIFDFERLVLLLPKMQRSLQSLPLVFVNPDLNFGTRYLDELGVEQEVIVNWHIWSIEPIGSGWPTDKKGFWQLDIVLKEAMKKRADLLDLSLNHIEMAALAFGLEKLCTMQKFDGAFKLLPELLSRLDTT